MAGLTVSLREMFPRPIAASEFRPWWETVLFFLFNVLLVIDVMIFLITKNISSMDCVPLPEGSSMLSVSQTNYINSVCSNQVDGIYHFAGWGVLFGCVLLYIAYFWWEMVSKVKDCFLAVESVDKILREKLFVRSQIKEFATTSKLGLENVDWQRAVSNKRSAMEVIDACHQLYIHRGQRFSIFLFYNMRNIIGCILVVIFSILILWVFVLKSDEEIEGMFICSLNDSTVATDKTQLLCFTSLPIQLWECFLAIFCILVAILLITVVVIITTLMVNRRTKISKKASKNGRVLAQDYSFVLFFIQHSARVHESTKTMLSLLENDFVLDEIYRKCSTAILSEDSNSINLLLSLHKEGGKKFSSEMKSCNVRTADRSSTKEPCVTNPNILRRLLNNIPDIFRFMFSEKLYFEFLLLHSVLFCDCFFDENRRESAIFGIDYEGCCYNITVTKKLLEDPKFYKALRRINSNENHGSRIVMHILIQLLPREDRKAFALSHPDLDDVLQGLKDRKIIDQYFDLEIYTYDERTCDFFRDPFACCLNLWMNRRSPDTDPREIIFDEPVAAVEDIVPAFEPHHHSRSRVIREWPLSNQTFPRRNSVNSIRRVNSTPTPFHEPQNILQAPHHRTVPEDYQDMVLSLQYPPRRNSVNSIRRVSSTPVLSNELQDILHAPHRRRAPEGNQDLVLSQQNPPRRNSVNSIRRISSATILSNELRDILQAPYGRRASECNQGLVLSQQNPPRCNSVNSIQRVSSTTILSNELTDILQAPYGRRASLSWQNPPRCNSVNSIQRANSAPMLSNVLGGDLQAPYNLWASEDNQGLVLSWQNPPRCNSVNSIKRVNSAPILSNVLRGDLQAPHRRWASEGNQGLVLSRQNPPRRNSVTFVRRVDNTPIPSNQLGDILRTLHRRRASDGIRDWFLSCETPRCISRWRVNSTPTPLNEVADILRALQSRRMSVSTQDLALYCQTPSRRNSINSSRRVSSTSISLDDAHALKDKAVYSEAAV